MPQDYEINWREHRPSIKGRNIFRMILNSSFKHHTASMRLLFVALTCLAACSALPQLKQKRDILPGDPRYENNHHHSHENVIEDAKTSTGYSFSAPEKPLDTYGPPGFQPGVPLNGDYLNPVVDATKYSTSTLTERVPDFVHIPEVTKKSDELHDVHVEKTVKDVTVEEVKSVTVTPPATSYGIPVFGDVKIPDKSEIGVDTHVKNVETVKTKIDNHEIIDVHTPSVKIVEHTPVKQEVTHVTSDVKTVPAVTTTVTKEVNSWLNGDTSKVGTSLGETFDIPSIDFTYGLPSGFYNFPQSTFNTFHNGFDSYGLGLSSVEVPPPLPLSLHGTNGIPTSYSFTQDIKIPRTDLHVPYSLAHFVQRTQPAHILQSLPSASSLDTFSSSVHLASSLDSLTAVQPVSYTDTLTKVHADTSVKTIESLPHAEHTVHAVPSVKSVETVSTVHSVPTVKTISSVHAVPTVDTVHTVKAVPTLHTLPPLKTEHLVKAVPTLHTLPPLKTEHSVKTLPTLHALPTVNTVHPVETLSTVHSSPSVEEISSFHVTPTVPTVHALPTVRTVHPVSTLQHLPTVKTVHPVETVSTFHPLPTVKTVHPVETVSTFHPLPTVKTVHPVESVPTFHHLPTVKTVHPIETVSTVHSIPTVKTVHPVESVPTFYHLPTVKTVHPVESVPTFHHLPTVKTVHPVETVPTFHHLPTVKTVHPVETVSTVHSVPIVKTIPSVHVTPTVETLSTVHPIETVSAVHSVPTVKTIPSVHVTSTVETLPTVHSVPLVKTIPSVHVTPTLETFPTVHTLSAVDNLSTLHSVPSVKTLHTVDTSSTIHSVPAVKTIPSIHAVPTVDAFSAVHSLPTVKTVPTLHVTPTVDTLTHVDTLHTVDNAENLSGLYPVSTLQVETDHTATNVFKTDDHVQIQEKGALSDFIHGIFSHFGSAHFPGFTTTTTTTTTTAAPATQNRTYYIADNVHQESLTIDNPLLSNDDHIVSSVPSASGYVQPTDVNGGYIYRK